MIVWRRTLLPALLVLILPLAARAEDPIPTSELGPRVNAILDQLAGNPPATAAAVLKKLGPLGPRAATTVLAAGATRMGPAYLEVMAGALSAWKDRRLGRKLLLVAEGPKDLPTQRMAFKLLGKHGRAAEVPDLIRIFGKHAPEATSDANAALTGIVGRLGVDEARSCLSEPLRNSAAATRMRLVRCIVASGAAAARDMLTDLMGSDPGLDTVILPGVVKMPGAARSKELLEKVRRMLEATSVNLRREGAMAAGRLRDVSAIPMLIDLLDDEIRGVTVNAHWALQSVTGCRLPADSRRWRTWLEGERAWWKAEGHKHLDVLASGNDEYVLLAIQALARGIVFREEIVAGLEPLTEDSNPEVSEAALSVLKKLGAR